MGSEILPHEADVRKWLRRTLDPDDLEDVIQETYCRIAMLKDISAIRSGRAYFFTAARSVVLTRLRRERIVRIDTVAEIETLNVISEEPSPERVATGRRELARVRSLIAVLPDRCRRIFELRKIEGLPYDEIASIVGVDRRGVDNDIRKGLKLILKALAEGDAQAERKLMRMEYDERTRDAAGD